MRARAWLNDSVLPVIKIFRIAEIGRMALKILKLEIAHSYSMLDWKLEDSHIAAAAI
jgi:hypothetical protein